uniref:t-SNARE coiled-coil homology domain-containing protein n=1 Tax=Chenopodium quinoa TaxID=63459 RepID=A0A803M2Z6_CHEQI
MSLVDIITRVDAICNKYDKYDVDKRREFDVSGEDAFARFYSEFQSNIDTAVEKSDAASSEKNRASAVALFAEVRRIKARLLEELPKLHKLAFKKDEGLDYIAEGLDSLKDMAQAMNEEIDRQEPLMDEMDKK